VAISSGVAGRLEICRRSGMGVGITISYRAEKTDMGKGTKQMKNFGKKGNGVKRK
jgi:hypothetical protein